MKLTTGRLIEPREVAETVVVLAYGWAVSTRGADYVVDAGLLKKL